MDGRFEQQSTQSFDNPCLGNAQQEAFKGFDDFQNIRNSMSGSESSQSSLPDLKLEDSCKCGSEKGGEPLVDQMDNPCQKGQSTQGDSGPDSGTPEQPKDSSQAPDQTKEDDNCKPEEPKDDTCKPDDEPIQGDSGPSDPNPQPPSDGPGSGTPDSGAICAPDNPPPASCGKTQGDGGADLPRSSMDQGTNTPDLLDECFPPGGDPGDGSLLPPDDSQNPSDGSFHPGGDPGDGSLPPGENKPPEANPEDKLEPCRPEQQPQTGPNKPEQETQVEPKTPQNPESKVERQPCKPEQKLPQEEQQPGSADDRPTQPDPMQRDHHSPDQPKTGNDQPTTNNEKQSQEDKKHEGEKDDKAKKKEQQEKELLEQQKRDKQCKEKRIASDTPSKTSNNGSNKCEMNKC